MQIERRFTKLLNAIPTLRLSNTEKPSEKNHNHQPVVGTLGQKLRAGEQFLARGRVHGRKTASSMDVGFLLFCFTEGENANASLPAYHRPEGGKRTDCHVAAILATTNRGRIYGPSGTPVPTKHKKQIPVLGICFHYYNAFFKVSARSVCSQGRFSAPKWPLRAVWL